MFKKVRTCYRSTIIGEGSGRHTPMKHSIPNPNALQTVGELFVLDLPVRFEQVKS